MSRIEQLHQSLLTMIVRYYVAKLTIEANTEKEALDSVAPDESEPHALSLKIKLLTTLPETEMIAALTALPETTMIAALTALPETRVVAALTALINAATEGRETTSVLSMHIPRRPLLLYILHGVTTLKSIVESQEQLSEDCIAHEKEQLTQLIIDVQTLISTPQSTEIECKYDTNIVKINGFVRPLWKGYSLCVSGTILQDTLFSALDLPLAADPIRIKKTVSSILTEHQAHLLKSLVKKKDEKILHLEKALELSQSELELQRCRESAKKLSQKGLSTFRATTGLGRVDMETNSLRVRTKEDLSINKQPSITTAQNTVQTPHHARSTSTHSWPRSISSGFFAIARVFGDAILDPDPITPEERSIRDAVSNEYLVFPKQI